VGNFKARSFFLSVSYFTYDEEKSHLPGSAQLIAIIGEAVQRLGYFAKFKSLSDGPGDATTLNSRRNRMWSI
jgi:hypothetical protein